MEKKELIARHAELTWEALFIALAIEDIHYGVDYTDFNVNNSVQLITYSLQMVNTTKWKRFSTLVDQLTQAAQLDKDDSVRVSYSGLDYRIEVPKPKQLHDTVDMSSVFDNSSGLNFALGVSAYDNKTNNVSFEGNNAGHMLVSGSTRCGKTNILKIIAMLLMYKNTPDKVRLAVIDTVKAKGKYGVLENSSHLATEILNTPPKAIAFLTWVKNEIIKLEGRKMDKKIIILIDEVSILAKNKEVADLLAYIASAGAEVGFHIIAATQFTKVDDIGGKQFKGNLMTRVAGRVDDHYASSNATGKEGAGAENLSVPGDFLVVKDSGIDRVAVPEIKDKFFDRVERGMTPIMNLNWTDEELTGLAIATPRPPSVAACFEKIDHRLLHLAINGRNSRTGKPFGADVLRKASKVLENKGLGDAIGQSTAHEYVMFAKKLRGVK